MYCLMYKTEMAARMEDSNKEFKFDQVLMVSNYRAIYYSYSKQCRIIMYRMYLKYVFNNTFDTLNFFFI